MRRRPKERKKFITIAIEELTEKIAKHALWLQTKDTPDPQGEQLVLKNYDLTGYYLINENLAYSNFQGCRLNKAKLNGTNFSSAQFDFCDLNGAIMIATNFENASMKRCFFRGAKMFYANLKNANLTWSSLQYCDLAHTNLDKTIFINAFLYGAQNKDLTKAILNKNETKAKILKPRNKSSEEEHMKHTPAYEMWKEVNYDFQDEK